MTPTLQSWIQLALLILVLLATVLHLDQRFAAVDKRFDSIEKRFEERFADLSRRMDTLERTVDQRFADFRLWMQAELTGIRSDLASGLKRLEGRIERLEHPVLTDRR